jgi:perosamine synthetase
LAEAKGAPQGEMLRVPPVRVVFEDEDRRRILAEIDEVLSSGMVAASKKVKALEEFWAEYSGCKYAVACSNGGAALEILMKAMDVKGKDVLVPTNTFVATVNAVIFAGGTPVFLDMDISSMGVSLEEMQRKRTPNTVGVVPVHIGGIISSEMDAISQWCEEEGLWLVEDGAHAVGSELNGRRAGQFGAAATYSFFATKVITSGEGGMIVTNDESLAQLARGLADYGKRSQWETVHTYLSSNYRMNDITAVIGMDQSRRLDEFIQHREHVAEQYTKAFSELFDLVLPPGRSSWYKYILMAPEGVSQEDVKTGMKARGISMAGGVYDIPVHMQPVFQAMGNMPSLPIAEEYCPRHLCPPIFYGMSDQQIDHVTSSLIEVVEGLKPR